MSRKMLSIKTAEPLSAITQQPQTITKKPPVSTEGFFFDIWTGSA